MCAPLVYTAPLSVSSAVQSSPTSGQSGMISFMSISVSLCPTPDPELKKVGAEALYGSTVSPSCSRIKSEPSPRTWDLLTPTNTRPRHLGPPSCETAEVCHDTLTPHSSTWGASEVRHGVLGRSVSMEESSCHLDTEWRRESQRLTHPPKLGHSGLVQRIQEGREEGKEGGREEREEKRMRSLRAPSAHILLSQLSP